MPGHAHHNTPPLVSLQTSSPSHAGRFQIKRQKPNAHRRRTTNRAARCRLNADDDLDGKGSGTVGVVIVEIPNPSLFMKLKAVAAERK